MTVKRLQRARVAAWTPYSIPLSLRPLYLSAADLAATPVSSWTGRQGGLVLTATGSPAWSAIGLAGAYPMVSGDGSAAYLTSASTTGLPTGTAPCVLAGLVQPVSSAGYIVGYGGASSGDHRRLQILSGGTGVRVSGGGTFLADGAGVLAPGQPAVVVGIITSTELILRVQGVEVARAQGTLASTGTSRTRLFANTSTTPAALSAAGTTELLIGTTWTERQILQFEGYCAHTYPLAGIALPDSHPYKYSAP